MVSVEASSPSSQSRRNGGVIQEAAFSLPKTTLMSPMKTVRTAVLISQTFHAGKRRSRTKRISHSVDERKSSSTVRLQCGKTISRGRNKCLSKSEEAARLIHTRGSPSNCIPSLPASAETMADATTLVYRTLPLLPSEMLPRSPELKNRMQQLLRYKCCGCLAPSTSPVQPEHMPCGERHGTARAL